MASNESPVVSGSSERGSQVVPSTTVELIREPMLTAPLSSPFFESLIGGNAAKALLIAKPHMLTRSMERRIKPRVVEIQEAGIPIMRALEVGISAGSSPSASLND